MAMKAEELLRPLTYEDLEAYDDPRYRYEIIYGELVASPSAAPTHAEIVTRLMLAFGNVNETSKLGHVWASPVDVELSANNVVIPDLLFIARDTLRIAKNHVVAAPDLAIEVVSPSSRTRDYITKRVMYENAGIKEYWIVDPIKKSVDVLILEEGKYVRAENEDGVVRSTVVPGVEIEIQASLQQSGRLGDPVPLRELDCEQHEQRRREDAGRDAEPTRLQTHPDQHEEREERHAEAGHAHQGVHG